MTIRCRFDGKAFVPETPVDLPVGTAAEARPVDGAIFTGGAGGTVGDLLRSGAIGSWKNRADIKDSQQFARELRQRVEHRRDRE